MENEVWYPSAEEVIELNALSLDLVRVKKADRHELLSAQKLSSALDKCRQAEGGIYMKAAVLMRALASAHAFASGNRRTAFIAAKEFVVRNGKKFAIVDQPHYAKTLQGIREGRYSDQEIMEWIEHGKIREAKR